MRLLTIQLLLLGTQLTSAAKGDKCDGANIQGNSAEYTYKNNQLTCTKSNKKIEVVSDQVTGTLYSKLKCDDNTGWKDAGNPLNPPFSATDDIKIVCKVPTAQECDQSLITGFDSLTMKYDNKILTCTKPEKIVEYTTKQGPKSTTSKLACVPSGEWTADSGKIGIDSKNTVTVACVFQACAEGLITNNGVTFTKLPKPELKCAKKVKIGNEFYASLTCDKDNGWIDPSGNNVKKSTETFTVDCADLPACHKDFITATNGAVTSTANKLSCPTGKVLQLNGQRSQYDKIDCKVGINKWQDANGQDTHLKGTDPIDVQCVTKPPPPCSIAGPGTKDNNNILTCPSSSNGNPAYIDFNTKQYTHLKCVGTEWKNVKDEVVTDASGPLTFTCIEYCKSTIPNELNYVEDPSNSKTYKVECKSVAGQIKGIFHGPPGNENQVKDVTCSMAGWKAGNNVLVADSMTDLKLECRQGCKAANDWLSDAKIDETSDGNKQVFKCKEEKPDENHNGMELDGKFVNSHLYCDANNGWADIADKQLADAFTKVTITCSKVMCNPGKSSLCNTLDIPVGYSCHGTEKQRFPGLSGDPNLLKCPDNKIIYDFKSSKFFDKTLRCKPDDKSYAIIDDPLPVSVLSGDAQLMCLDRRCNKCPLLPPTAATAPPAVTKSSPLSTPGTAADCAKAECTNDLWMLEYTDQNGDPFSEEYAGKVECSSEEATLTKWVIDGDKIVTAGSCIDEIASCEKSAPLFVICENEWTVDPFGCAQLQLQGSGDNTCTSGLSLYYKAKGDYAFYKAEKIACQLKEGWKLTVIKEGGGTEDKTFGRGGTVICAKENPSPVTTTAAPTTTTPFVAPCQACPTGDEVLNKCPKCSEKKPQFEATSDNEKCQASGFTPEVSFETEKEGVVKEKLVCDKTEKIWKTQGGKEVGLFAFTKGEPETAENTGLIIGGAVGGVVFLIALLGVIFYVLVGRKKRPNEQDEETKRKMLEEGKKKRRTKDGDNNDEILDEVSVDAPAEIKL